MAVCRSLFRNVSAHVSEPDKIVTALNEALSEGNEMNMFVTLFVGILDLRDGHLLYCNAGHDAPLVVGQEVTYLPCDPNLPAGVMSDWQFSVQQTTLQPGTTIFLYTDGLNEAEDVNHAQFGDQQVQDVATTLLNEGKTQAKEVVKAMTQAVHAFAGDAEQSDDLTLLAIRYKQH